MSGKVLTFYMGGYLFGVDILAIKEINRKVEFTAVPDAPAHIVGLLNMRGQVVTLMDLAGLMGYRLDSGNGQTNCIILKNSQENPDYIGFFIDHPGSVLDINEESCEPPPPNVSMMENRFVDRIVKLEEDLLLIINHSVIYDQ
jgi:purine-binding chemotaxis protein CheW